MNHDTRLKRLHFRAHHRGIREADILVGAFFDAHGACWNEAEVAWFEVLLEEQDVDILAWATGAAVPPPQFEGGPMTAMRRLDYLIPAA